MENWEKSVDYSYEDWKKREKEILNYLIQIFNIDLEAKEIDGKPSYDDFLWLYIQNEFLEKSAWEIAKEFVSYPFNRQDLIKKEKIIRISNEHEEYKWCTENEAKTFLKWENNIIALNKLINLIKLEYEE